MVKEVNKTTTRRHLTKTDYILIVLSLVVVGSILFGLVRAMQIDNAKKAAVAAEQARLAADPVTVNGIYSAINKERSSNGAPALSTISNLTTAADQYCNDMVANKYFDYKNPTTGKDSNSYITDNQGNYYFKNYVSSIFQAVPATQTATDSVTKAIASQATNLNSPMYNSVGWSVCQSPINPGTKYVVGMLADKEDKPVAPVQNTTTRYVPTYVPAPTSIYSSPTHCYTNYNTYGGYLDPTASTTCY